jgi:tRNA(His) 5'-end guanylyltransferase
MLVHILNSLLSSFSTPKFQSGARVNHMANGHMSRFDGRVITQTSQGVLVEWPRAGSLWEQPDQLCQQS